MKRAFRKISLILAIIMVLSALPLFAVADIGDNEFPADLLDGPFKDVQEGMWFYSYVIWAYEGGYVKGISENMFAPNNNITRADFVTVLGRYEGIDVSEWTGTKFSDVPEGKYYTAYINWAAENGIVTGVGNDRFAPLTNITREQMALIFVRYATYLGKVLAPTEATIDFADASSISSWAEDAVYSAQKAGVITGTNTGYFLPKNNATRAEFCTMLMRFSSALEKASDIVTDRVLTTYYNASIFPFFNTMFEEDVKALDIIYYNGLMLDDGGVTYMNNSSLKSSDLDELREINTDLKILLAVASMGGNAFFYNATIDDRDRAKLVEDIIEKVEKFGFDGIDIDWEFPENAYDKAANADFMQELRAALDGLSEKTGKTYLLTIAVPATYWPIRIFDMDVISEVCDYINIMNYDMNLSNPYTLHHTAPKEDGTGLSYNKDSSAEETIKTFLANGIPSNKILVGCGLYSIGRSNVPANDKNGYGVYTGQGYNPAISAKYNNLIYRIEAEGFTRYWDDTAKAPYLYNADKGVFLSYDDDDSVKVKAELAHEYNLGGMMLFEYSTYYSRSYSLASSAKEWIDGNFDYPPAIDWSQYM